MWEDNPGIYFPPKAEYWKMKPSKELKLYKKPTKRTIKIGSYHSKSSSKDFIKNLNIKKNIGNYFPKIIYLTKKELKRYLNRIKKNIKVEQKFGQKKLINFNKKFILNRVYDFPNPFERGQKSFIFYLTKKQIKYLENFRMLDHDRPRRGRNDIIFTNDQLVKTYKEVIKINSYIYYYKDFGRFKKSTPPPKLLAISDKPYNNQEILNLVESLEKDLIDFGHEEKDLIDFGNEEEKDLIDFGNEEEKDLIDLNTIIPNNPPLTQDLLMDKKLFQKGKKYKVLQNKDLIPITTNPTTNGVNILKNILTNSETKRLLGISLTSDLKEKIENLGSEASFGLASILSALLTANRGKMSVYSISRNQLKEIIEGFFTTLSVLLNPAQKY